jgi:hypothetical protein
VSGSAEICRWISVTLALLNAGVNVQFARTAELLGLGQAQAALNLLLQLRGEERVGGRGQHPQHLAPHGEACYLSFGR